MCSETFLRLPEEKRVRFLDAAWQEFSRVPYTEASINKIVRQARIPRGSFYQYFTGKEDLFFYLMGDMLKQFYAKYNEVLGDCAGDMFRAQINCYERLILNQDAGPLLDKGIELLKLNPEILVQSIVENENGYGFWEAVRESIDLAAFRSEEMAKQTFLLSLVSLVTSLRDTADHAKPADVGRKELEIRLEILRHGSYARQFA